MIAIRWQNGGEGELMSLDGENVVVWSSRAWAPGSRPEGSLADGAAFRFKTHRCRKDPAREGFIVDGRALDFTRALRERLTAELSAENNGGASPDDHA
ncbi:MAG: hypothetical protein U0271_20500 [Polyangiaceae bacterium]